MGRILFKFKLEENCPTTEDMDMDISMDMVMDMDINTDMTKKENLTLNKNIKETEKIKEPISLPKYMEENQINMKYLLKKTMISRWEN